MAVKASVWSIRTRLVWGAVLVLLVFLAMAGWAVQQAYLDSLREQRFARLQTTIYLLMAGAELDASGVLIMPASLAEPRLSLPGSGLYASITNLDNSANWQSASALGLTTPFARPSLNGQWQFDTLGTTKPSYLAASYAVKWSVQERQWRLVFSVLEDSTDFDRELQAFARTLWSWLGGSALLLLLSQTFLLRWGLAPLGQMAQEIERIEQGQQNGLTGIYPKELASVTDNLNLLMAQERARQTRYKDALDDLAHSLKTPLAALRASLSEPAALSQVVTEQVARMDNIVVHQLGRAGASGAARFVAQLALAPVLARVVASLGKIYQDKNLKFDCQCATELRWRIDEGDAFEILGNLLDNAAKWAKQQVVVSLWINANKLHLRVSDDGPGFTDHQAGSQRRVRLDELVPGHGIGLAVVRDLVTSHLGELTIAQSQLGGAQIDIVLPAA